MLMRNEEFAFIAELERHYSVFATELNRLERDAFIEWPDRGAYTGTWLVCPLFLPSAPPGVDHLYPVNQRRCPNSTRALRSIRGVVAAAFSCMEPGCTIPSHTDVKPVDRLRAHLGLETPDGSMMRVGPDLHEWSTGRCLLFDGCVEHETANMSEHRRVVLLVDVDLNVAEMRCLTRWHAELEARGVATAGPEARESALRQLSA